MARRAAQRNEIADWQISRITGKGAVQIGRVQAPDAGTAIELAIRKYDIEPGQQNRIAARPIA